MVWAFLVLQQIPNLFSIVLHHLPWCWSHDYKASNIYTRALLILYIYSLILSGREQSADVHCLLLESLSLNPSISFPGCHQSSPGHDHLLPWFLLQPPLMTLVSSLGFLHSILNIETGVIFQNFPSNDVTPLPNIPSDWLAQLHDAALSSLAMSLVMFPCSLHTDSILKMYLHPIWCKLLFVFHLYHYFYMLSLSDLWKLPIFSKCGW